MYLLLVVLLINKLEFSLRGPTNVQNYVHTGAGKNKHFNSKFVCLAPIPNPPNLNFTGKNFKLFYPGTRQRRFGRVYRIYLQEYVEVAEGDQRFREETWSEKTSRVVVLGSVEVEDSKWNIVTASLVLVLQTKMFLLKQLNVGGYSTS